MFDARLSQVGLTGSFGGRVGLKLTWHMGQAIPTRNGGFTEPGSSRYFLIDHFLASNFLLVNSWKPTTPLEYPKTSGSHVREPSFIRSIMRPYWSGFSAGTQSGSLMRPILSQRSARGVVCNMRRKSWCTLVTLTLFPQGAAIFRQHSGLSTPHHQCQVSMPSPTLLGSTP